MPFNEFLDLVKVMKMLYGREIAEKFFAKNIQLYYNLDSASISKTKEGQQNNG